MYMDVFMDYYNLKSRKILIQETKKPKFVYILYTPYEKILKFKIKKKLFYLLD